MESGNPFQIVDALANRRVPCVIIGGHAVNYHGYLRATEDTDIVIRRTAEVEQALFTGLQELNACWIGDEIDPSTGIERTFPVTPDYIRATRMMMLVTDLGFLDIFDFVPGLPDTDVQVLFDSAIDVEGRKFVSLEWLRRMKQAADRAKDRLDLESLPEG